MKLPLDMAFGKSYINWGSQNAYTALQQCQTEAGVSTEEKGTIGMDIASLTTRLQDYKTLQQLQ
jgi:hypothetical protein